MASPLEVDGNASGLPETPVVESALALPKLSPFPIPKSIDPHQLPSGNLLPHHYPSIFLDRLIAPVPFTMWTSLPLIAITPVPYTVLYSMRRGLLHIHLPYM
jgi:hypothetical protein